jgi:hypothetical protein
MTDATAPTLGTFVRQDYDLGLASRAVGNWYLFDRPFRTNPDRERGARGPGSFGLSSGGCSSEAPGMAAGRH